jgi:hypothetical protein
MTETQAASADQPGHELRTYFIDESGNSGDLANPGPTFAFDNQEIFTLVAVGVEEPNVLSGLVTALKSKHRIQAPELSFDSVRKKPAFMSDLFDALDDLNANLISEVVDKRYFIGANMISYQILPPSGGPTSPEEHWVRYHLAEELSRAPMSVFQAFVTACRAPSGDTLAKSFQAVIDWVGPRPANEVAQGLRHGATLGLKEFREGGPDDADNQAEWLPKPDRSHNDRLLWILPNLSSFANVYARINRFHNRAIEGVRLVHDEQRYYERVLQESKALAETPLMGRVNGGLRHADWRFESSAELVFADSKTVPGVQVADVLAGFLMDYVRDKFHRGNGRSKEWKTLFMRLNDTSDGRLGTGINFVVPNRSVHLLGLVPMPDPFFANGDLR